MLIFDDKTNTIIIDDIYTPTLSDSFWVLDLELMDFTITPLLTLEEITSQSVKVLVNGYEFSLPTTWNILVIDNETSQLDSVEAGELAGSDFSVFSYGPNKWSFASKPIRVTDYRPSYSHIAPSLNKHQMLCHPIGPDEWVNVSPSDCFNRYLKGRVAGDLI